MAKINVKLFGVYRMDTHIAQTEINAQKLPDLFTELNKLVTEDNKNSIAFKDAAVFVNGEHCKKRNYKFNDGDEVWLLSPASGG